MLWTRGSPRGFFSADVYRIAAADQIRSLASLLGIGCDIADTPGTLAQMLEEHRSKGLVLIDTPGLTRSEMEDASDLACLLQSHPEIDTHLVLPAFLRPGDMSRTIGHYLPFGPKKASLHPIDETQHYGAMASIANRWSLPISFLGTGQQIPDDLEPATAESLAKLILSSEQRPQASRLLQRGAAA